MDGNELKKWRTSRGLTQRKIGEWLGLAKSNSIYKIENGLRKISPAEELVLRDKMAMFDADEKSGRENFSFTDEEISIMARLAQKDGVNDPILWARMKIKAFLKASKAGK